MEINNRNSAPTFQSRLIANDSLNRVKKYAAKIGKTGAVDDINKAIKNLGNLKIRVLSNYSKTFKTSKTQLEYEKNGLKYVHVFTDNTTTIAEKFTLKILEDLVNPLSEVFQKIF